MQDRILFFQNIHQELITTIQSSANIHIQSMPRKTRRRRESSYTRTTNIKNNNNKMAQKFYINHNYKKNCLLSYSILSMLIIFTSLFATNYFTQLSEATTNLGSQFDIKLAAAAQTETIDKQPKAEALKQDQQTTSSTTTNSNVIIIKYANVTKSITTTTARINSDESEQHQQAGITTTSDQQQYDDKTALNVYKLIDEPLSVSVIESKFAHSIQLFDVSQNQLSTLSNNLFCPLSNEVRLLNVSHNLLENFDSLGLISQTGQLCLNELRILDMSYNLIKHLPATGVASLHNLEILNLSNNLIKTLDELSLSSLFRLSKLDLSHNHIQQLPMVLFQKSYSMQVLKLQSNQLQITINEIFLSGLISLEELDLSQNNISHVSDFAFLDKVNLTRVDLRYNRLSTLRQEALRVTTSVKQISTSRHRVYHNGQYAGTAPKQTHSQSVSAEFYLSSNPFICDCQLEWIRTFQPQSAIKSSVLSSMRSKLTSNYQAFDPSFSDQYGSQLMQLTSNGGSLSSAYQNDQPSVISASSSDSSNNISEILAGNQALLDSTTNQASRPLTTLLTASQQQSQQHVTHHYAKISDLDLIKCTPLFRRNTHRNQHHHHHDQNRHRNAPGQSRALAPSDGSHHTNNHHGHQLTTRHQQDNMIDLLSADSSNFLCRYKSHCFALCHCCEFDACDCEMICPNGCNCYYDLTWKTNIIDCSSNNHTVVPDRIPMDVTGLYLDGNNIDSLKPSNLIARKNLKSLYLNSTNLQVIANRTFNGLIELQSLYLNDNMLRSLNGYEFEPLAQLKALYLQSNRLDYISNQTFIYLRSLEILDLSNNRLTSSNLDLFWSIGHHNIRLRQLSIAHNWWSCQCSSINKFRQILKQKFLLNGSVNIADKNQLRCYYNSTTVGPLILADGVVQSQQPLYASHQRQQQQTLLTEINQCSDIIEDNQRYPQDINPPFIHSPSPPQDPQQDTINEYSDRGGYFEPMYPGYNPLKPMDPSQPPVSDQPDISSSTKLIIPIDGPLMTPNMSPNGSNNQRNSFGSSSMPLTSFILLFIFFVAIIIIAMGILVFIRQQQQNYNQNHHKKSSAASTTSASSSASSTAISSLNGTKSHRSHNQHTTLQYPHPHHHHHHLVMSNGSHGGATTTNINHHTMQHNHHHHHHHSASSQSNIYAALVSPTTGNSTTVTNVAALNNNNNNNNNLYSNSSTTASHHSSSPSQVANGYQTQHWNQQHSSTNGQQIYNQPYTGMNLGSAIENHYTFNASSQTSYKNGGGSLYNSSGLNYHGADAYVSSPGSPQQTSADWIKLPKVKQFVSKLVNKSLALGGYRACSRDELSTITSDKIYDAFISYDKRDEAFVMQHLSAELEYGQPQYR